MIMMDDCKEYWLMVICMGSLRRNINPSVTLFTTNLTWITLGLNQGLQLLIELDDLQKTSGAGLSNAGAMAPVIYFPGALIYSAGFNVN
jgi:hypothetical protein